jgi:alpha-L-rhamnosidase
MVDGITWVKASKDTPYGLVKVEWKKEGDSLNMEVEIPVGSTATVHLPQSQSLLLTSGHHQVSSQI